MFKKATFIILIFFISINAFSQNSVNDYKYVTVPNTFEFLTEANQYRLNNLTKLLFEKHGFTAFMEGETLPDDAISNSCLILKSNVIKEKGMFNSKLRVQLKNCKGDVVFTSELGQSREKKYQVAYTLALREAFNSFEVLNYTYNENAVIMSYGSDEPKVNNEEVEKLKEEISALKEEKEKLKEETKELPQEVKEDKPTVVEIAESSQNNTVASVLYAQRIDGGFQLVDSTPKVVYKIKKTGMMNVFLVDGKEAIIYQLDANWVLEYYENNKLKTKLLNIKF